MNHPDGRLIVGLWLIIMLTVVGFAGFLFLSRSNSQVKRRVFRWYIGVGGALILLWFWVIGGPIALLFGIPLFAISAFISLKTTRFCDSCGRTLMNQFIRARYCPRCGADLGVQDKKRSENRGKE